MNFLKRCFAVCKLLDSAKLAKLIPEDPPLLNPSAKLAATGPKSTINFLIEWSGKWLGKVGAIKKHLAKCKYELTYSQKSIDEVDCRVDNICHDFQSGIFMGKFFEIMSPEIDVLSQMRFNPGAKTSMVDFQLYETRIIVHGNMWQGGQNWIYSHRLGR